ncbi:hypothetical protein HMSSN036_67510 [Paenibacillus macerans]|nr:hypothetical protein HMSSN036_67510 [Paenibacillus macerans]
MNFEEMVQLTETLVIKEEDEVSFNFDPQKVGMDPVSFESFTKTLGNTLLIKQAQILINSNSYITIEGVSSPSLLGGISVRVLVDFS